jgi:hypothetical protein
MEKLFAYQNKQSHAPRGLQAPNIAKHGLQAADQNNSKPTTAMEGRYTASGQAL